MTEEAKKAVENFKNYIKDLENKQECLYNNEEFYKDDIEQNELFLKMLHAVLNLIQKLQEENKKKDKIIDLMADKIASDNRSINEEYAVDEKMMDTKYIKQYFEKKGDGDEFCM